MIDAHCHLEQDELYVKLDNLVPKWKQELNFIVSSCAHVKDLDKTIEISKKFGPFVRVCIGLHPEFIKELKDEDLARVIKFIRRNLGDIVAIGEVGLDYHWVKEPEFQEKQKALFIKFIRLAKELNLPLVIHSRDSRLGCIEILEQENMQNKKVLMHLFTDHEYLERVIKNNWFISIGANITKSKERKKIARDMPLERIMLETDSPWFKQEGQEFGEPINVKIACEKIAEIKHLSFEEVEAQTDKNAIEFFGLKD